jgi:hypothetical protein
MFRAHRGRSSPRRFRSPTTVQTRSGRTRSRDANPVRDGVGSARLRRCHVGHDDPVGVALRPLHVLGLAVGVTDASGSAVQAHAHTASRSGSLTVTGQGSDSHADTGASDFADHETIEFVLAGSRVESQTHTASGTGTITLSGARTETHSHTASPTGAFTLSGARSESQTHTASGAGTGTITEALRGEGRRLPGFLLSGAGVSGAALRRLPSCRLRGHAFRHRHVVGVGRRGLLVRRDRHQRRDVGHDQPLRQRRGTVLLPDRLHHRHHHDFRCVGRGVPYRSCRARTPERSALPPGRRVRLRPTRTRTARSRSTRDRRAR